VTQVVPLLETHGGAGTRSGNRGGMVFGRAVVTGARPIEGVDRISGRYRRVGKILNRALELPVLMNRGFGT
jgi:hypothetical protein